MPAPPPDDPVEPSAPEARSAPKPRVIRPSRGLPSSRAAVGGLLVAVAAIGTWVAATGGGGGDRVGYVVARHDLAPGVELSADDLAVEDADLPEPLRAAAFGDPDELVGAVTRAPIGAGELVQSGSITGAESAATAAEVSFAVDSDWAVAGGLRVGDRIDLYTTADDGSTELILGDVTVRSIGTPDDAFGTSASQVVTIAIDDPVDFDDAVAAVRTGDLTVVRLLGTAEEPGR